MIVGFPVLSLLAFLIPLSAYPMGGDGGGFNGPDDSTLIIPEGIDYGITFGELDRVAKLCLAKSHEQIRFTLMGGFEPGPLPACATAPQRERSSGRPHESPGYLDVSCTSPGDNPFPNTTLTTQAHRVHARYAASPDLSGVWILHGQRGFPYLHYGALEPITRVTPTGEEHFEQVQGITFRVEPGFEETGQAIEIARQFGPPLDPEAPLRINGRSYTDCVQAELQKTPADSPSPLPALPIELCPELTPWKNVLREIPPFATTPGWRSQFLQREWEARRSVIRDLYGAYERNTLDLNRIEGCLNAETLADSKPAFFETLYFEFYELTLARLRTTNSPGLRRYVDLTDRTYRDNHQRPLFRLTGHFDQNSPGSLFAGVHRASGSIYMDLSQIPRDEWYIIFIHEMAHKLDTTLGQAARDYALSQGLLSEFEGWAQRSSLAELPPDVREDLDAWLTSGLHRGLWAEFRAWYVTFLLYQEGLQERLWQPIPRFDAVIASKPAGVPFAEHLYSYLEARSKMPNTGIYASPLIKEAIRQLLVKMRTSGKTPALGSLEQVIRGSSSPGMLPN